PEVFNVLLQVLDDGRLTDGQGRTVDFRNTVIIMTSNLGSEYIQALLPHREQEAYERVMAAVRSHFRPEFLNRIDEIIMFRPLTREQLAQIVDIQLRQVRQRLKQRTITLQVTPRAKEWLAERGYDPVYGARPLKRVIQRELLDRLANQLLRGEIREGDTVIVDVDERGTLSVRSMLAEAEVVA
ncbi:MAG: AAA family ATPase, partial [Thermomicrobium sp.]|nr:AAA family ATPase [Thermomicrobium sp.]